MAATTPDQAGLRKRRGGACLFQAPPPYAQLSYYEGRAARAPHTMCKNIQNTSGRLFYFSHFSQIPIDKPARMRYTGFSL